MTAEILSTTLQQHDEVNTDSMTVDEFLRQIQRPAYRMAHLSTLNRDDALDIIQDAVLKLLQNYRDKPVHELKPLFYTILSSKLTDWHRKRQFRGKFQWLLGPEQDSKDSLEQIAIDLGQSAHDILTAERDMVELMKNLATLPERQRQVLLLRHWQGFSVQETADILKCTTGTIKTHLHRAISALRLTELEDLS